MAQLAVLNLQGNKLRSIPSALLTGPTSRLLKHLADKMPLPGATNLAPAANAPADAPAVNAPAVNAPASASAAAAGGPTPTATATATTALSP